MTDDIKNKEPKPVNDIRSKVDRMAFKYPKPRLITIWQMTTPTGRSS